MHTELKVGGMSCEHCVKGVKQALEAVPGVRSASVDLDAGRAVVEHDGPTEPLVSAVEEEGYSASVVSS